MRIKYDLELQTGDVLFPDMIEKCVILLRRDSGVGGIICEANLYQKSGEIIQQTPLYDADRMLGRENRLDYLIYGCFHRIFFFEKIKKQEETGKLDTWLYYDDPHFWYCRFLQATSNALLYLKEPLGNIDSDIMKWDCSLKKIMSSYVSVLQFIRTYEYSDEDGICSSQQEKIWENYAHMSLAMSCQLVLQERYREAEDCFLFSRVIWMPIEKNAFYLKIKDKFSLGSKEGWDTIMREIVEAR